MLRMLLFIAVMSPCALSAAEPENAETQEAVRAYVDPETGTLTTTPPPGSVPELAAPDMSKIVEIQHPNGMTEWQFNGQAMDATMAKVVDGELVTWCSQHGTYHAHEADTVESNDE